MKMRAIPIIVCMALIITPSVGRAQAGGNSGNVGDTDPIIVPLSIGGDVQLNRNGNFGPSVPGVNVTGYFGASGTGTHNPGPPQPPSPPTVSTVDFQAFEAEIIQ